MLTNNVKWNCKSFLIVIQSLNYTDEEEVPMAELWQHLEADSEWKETVARGGGYLKGLLSHWLNHVEYHKWKTLMLILVKLAHLHAAWSVRCLVIKQHNSYTNCNCWSDRGGIDKDKILMVYCCFKEAGASKHHVTILTLQQWVIAS
jgi:hypothetical protein